MAKPIRKVVFPMLNGGRNSRMVDLLVSGNPSAPMETPSSLNVDYKKIGGNGKRKGKEQRGESLGSIYAEATTDNGDFYLVYGDMQQETSVRTGELSYTSYLNASLSYTTQWAQKFTVGGSDIDLSRTAESGARFNSHLAVATSSPNGLVSAYIYTDNSGDPDAYVCAFDQVGGATPLVGSTRIVTLRMTDASATLTASTDYWIVVTLNDTSSFSGIIGGNSSSGSNLKKETSAGTWASVTGEMFFKLYNLENVSAVPYSAFYAQKITSTTATDVSQITLNFGVSTSLVTASVSIYSDSSGSPGSVITNGASDSKSLTASSTDSGVANTFSFPVAPSLSSTTDYWIVLEIASVPNFGCVVYIGGNTSSGTGLKYSSVSTPTWQAGPTGTLVYEIQSSNAPVQGVKDYQVESGGAFSQKIVRVGGDGTDGILYYQNGPLTSSSGAWTALHTFAGASGQNKLFDFQEANNLLFVSDHATVGNQVWNGSASDTSPHGYLPAFSVAANASAGGTWTATGQISVMLVTTLASGGYRAQVKSVTISNTNDHIDVSSVDISDTATAFGFEVTSGAYVTAVFVKTPGMTEYHKVITSQMANTTPDSNHLIIESETDFDILGAVDATLNAQDTLLDEYGLDDGYFVNQIATPKTKYMHGGLGFLALAGDPNNTSRVYLSAQYQPQIFSTQGGVEGTYYEVGQENDGQKVRAIRFVSGGFYAWKDRDVYFYQYTADVTLPFIPVKLKSNDMSCLSHFCIVETPHGIVFPSQNGMAIIKTGSLVVEPFAQERIGDLFESGSSTSFNLSAMQYATAANDPNKQIAVFGVSSNGATARDRVLVWDYELNNWGLRDGVNANYFATVSDADGFPELWSGGYTGILYKHEEGTNDDGSAISYEWETPWITFGGPDTWKRIRRISIKGEVQASGTLALTVYTDYSTTAKSTITMDMSDARFKNWLDKSINVRCKSIKVKLSNAELDTDVQIDAIAFEYQGLPAQR